MGPSVPRRDHGRAGAGRGVVELVHNEIEPLDTSTELLRALQSFHDLYATHLNVQEDSTLQRSKVSKA